LIDTHRGSVHGLVAVAIGIVEADGLLVPFSCREHDFEKAVGKTIPYVIDGRRAGDIAVCYADASKAKKLLNWEAKYTIEDMCRDSFRWQKNNPNGFEEDNSDIVVRKDASVMRK